MLYSQRIDNYMKFNTIQFIIVVVLLVLFTIPFKSLGIIEVYKNSFFLLIILVIILESIRKGIDSILFFITLLLLTIIIIKKLFLS